MTTSSCSDSHGFSNSCLLDCGFHGLPVVGSLQYTFFLFFISMDGVYTENRLERFWCISMDGVYTENRLAAILVHLHGRSYAENCSCIFCTSHVHVGRLKTAPRQLLLHCPNTVRPVHMHFLHFPRPCRSAENCSSAIAPALP